MMTKKRFVIAIILAIVCSWLAREAYPQEKEKRLEQSSRIELQRVVSGEFAKTKMSLPCNKKGFKIKVGEPITDEQLRKGIDEAKGCITGEAGASVQITRLEFKGKEIEVDLNDGSVIRKTLRQKIAEKVIFSGGPVGGPDIRTDTKVERPGDRKPQPEEERARPATIILDFGRDLPDMTPEELKQLLSVFLEFSERSAGVNWVETLPPEFQEAIAEQYAVPGMSKEIVLAALASLGLPEKQRGESWEFSDDRVWLETWQYGTPPVILSIIFKDIDDSKPMQGVVLCIKRLRPGESTACRESSKINSGFLPKPHIDPKPVEPAKPPEPPEPREPSEPAAGPSREPPPSLYPRP